MAKPDYRVRTLDTVQQCAQLGAHSRTVAWVTGLHVKGSIIRGVISAHSCGKRGRPRYNADYYFRAPCWVQADVSAFAVKYRGLRREGFAPAQSLIAAFRHYASFPESRHFGFDEAFFVICQLDGIWACPSRSLCLFRCQRCGLEHLCETGAAHSFRCPFCKELTRRHYQQRRSAALVHDGVIGAKAASDAVAKQIETLELKALLADAGADPRVFDVMVSGTAPHTRTRRRPYFAGRWPITLSRWNGSAVGTMRRAQLSLAATVYTRLVRLGCRPENAAIESHKHVCTAFPAADVVSFDSWFEVLQYFDPRWSAVEAALVLLSCIQCQMSGLFSLAAHTRWHCAFCRIADRPERYFPVDGEVAFAHNALAPRELTAMARVAARALVPARL